MPTAHSFSYTVTEAKRVRASGRTCNMYELLFAESCPGISGGKQTVQLLATDDPNEPSQQPLELFITSLPKLGKVQPTPPLDPLRFCVLIDLLP